MDDMVFRFIKQKTTQKRKKYIHPKDVDSGKE